MTIFIGLLIFLLGLVIGWILKTWWAKRKAVGTIHIIKEDTRTLYSLELEDYPDSLAFHKIVLFKVENPDRE